MTTTSKVASRFRHNLLQPTAGVRTILQAMHDQNASAEQWGRTVPLLLRANNELERDLETLSLFVMSDYGGLKPSLQPTDLHSVVASATARLTGPETARVAIEVVGEGTVSTDRELLRHSVCALIYNALEFSQETVNLVAVGDGSSITLAVRDRGTGLPDDFPEGAVPPFFVRHAERSSRASRLGLGLCVAQKVIDVLGGSLLVRAQEGGGTEAIITLS